MRRKHASHGNREEWRGEREADPETPRHVAQLGIIFFERHRPRLKRHAANWTIPRLRSHDLRVHRAGIFAPGRRERRRLGVESHATLRTRARADLPHLGAHWANVGWRNRGWRRSEEHTSALQ